MSEITFPKKTILDVALAGRTVLLRVDYNVPMDEHGRVQDDFRIEASIPTLKNLLEQKAKIILCSHMGRPGGKIDPKLSLRPVAEILARRIKREVKFVDDCVGPKVRAAVAELKPGDMLLLENLRFYASEENDTPDFARQLMMDTSASYFVQDGFGVIHRRAATVDAITQFLPSVAGLLVEQEWLDIKRAVDQPARPMVAIMGGAKISDKISLINKFIDTADGVVVGGALANNFLKYLGFNIGDSLYEPDMDETVKQILGRARNKFGSVFLDRFILPIDVAISKSGNMAGTRVEKPLAKTSDDTGFKILDIGSGSIERVQKLLTGARTVIWNGTMGVAEKSQWAEGSVAIAEAITNNSSVVSLVGGGDTASFARSWAAKNQAHFSHISTGGGAALELMAGEDMPGLDGLLDK
jgi:3-phosphoglycerate kinase